MADHEASVLITGGTGGLGAAVVGRFLTAGWRVVVPWVQRSEVDRLTPDESLRATYLVSQATVPHLIEAAGGAITCVSSRAALRPFAGAADADHSRWVRPEQIADVLLFLSGDAASPISGAHIPVYGLA